MGAIHKREVTGLSVKVGVQPSGSKHGDIVHVRVGD